MDRFLLPVSEVSLGLIDLQVKLAAGMPYREQVIRNCLLLLEVASLFKIPVWVTEQYPQGLGPTLPELQEALPDYQPFQKTTFDCCREEGFWEKIGAGGRNHILLTGIEAHVCVLQTALGLLRKGYQVQVVRDAVCSRKKTDFKTAIEWMRDAGAVITTTETVVFQLLSKSGTEAFKTLSPKIR